jgi:hypothetical protein
VTASSNTARFPEKTKDINVLNFLRKCKSRKTSCTVPQISHGIQAPSQFDGNRKGLHDIRIILHLMSHWVHLGPVTLLYAAYRRRLIYIPATIRQASALCYHQRGVGRILGHPSWTLDWVRRRLPRTASRRRRPMYDSQPMGSRKQEIATSATGWLVPRTDLQLDSRQNTDLERSLTLIFRAQGFQIRDWVHQLSAPEETRQGWNFFNFR